MRDEDSLDLQVQRLIVYTEFRPLLRACMEAILKAHPEETTSNMVCCLQIRTIQQMEIAKQKHQDNETLLQELEAREIASLELIRSIGEELSRQP